jgi:hypothetical protein
VQLVVLRWDKSARGGEGARMRSAVPAAFAVPEDRMADCGGQLVLDALDWAGRNGYSAPARRRFERSSLDDGVRAGSVTVTLDPSGLRLRYEYDPLRDGAPRRQLKGSATGNREPLAHERIVRAGKWVRVRSNGRFSDVDTGEWSYQQVTVNVAWFEGPPDGEVFLRRAPDQEIRVLADLW